MIHEPRYGRLLDDFVPGDVYAHPWEVTVDEGMTALFAASFQDATPTYASRAAARALGLRDRRCTRCSCSTSGSRSASMM